MKHDKKAECTPDTILRWCSDIADAWHTIHDAPRDNTTHVRRVPSSRIPGNAEAIAVRADLTHWAAFWLHALLDEHPDALPTDAHIDLGDTPAVLRALAAAAQVICDSPARERFWHGHHGEPGLHTWHARIATMINPPERTHLVIGPCPLPPPEGEGLTVCNGTVRTRIKDVRSPLAEARCNKCGIEAVLPWWRNKMPPPPDLVPAGQLLILLAIDANTVITEATLRQWVKRGHVTVAGRDGAKNLFDWRLVLWDVRRRAAA